MQIGNLHKKLPLYSRIIRKELARYEKKNNRKNTSDSDEMEDDESRRKSPDRKPINTKRHRDRRSPSTSRSRSRSPVKDTTKNSKTKAPVHLERKKMDKIKIDDQDLMTDSFKLPSKFKNSSTSNSVLKSTNKSKSTKTIDQKVNLNFKSDNDLDEKFGLEKKPRKPILRKRNITEENSTRSRSRSQSPIIPAKKKPSIHDRLTLSPSKLKSKETAPTGKIYSKAAKETFKRAERPPNEIRDITQRLNHKNENQQNIKVLEPLKNGKYTTKLAEIKHKEGRHGASHGMFSLDDQVGEKKTARKKNSSISERLSAKGTKSREEDDSPPEKSFTGLSRGIKNRLGPISIQGRLGH